MGAEMGAETWTTCYTVLKGKSAGGQGVRRARDRHVLLPLRPGRLHRPAWGGWG